MATLPARELKIGTIIDKTLGVVERSTSVAAIYVVAYSALIGAVTYFTVEMTAPMQQLSIGLGKFVVQVVAGYLLLDAMLRRTGLVSPDRGDIFVAFLAMLMVSTIGIMLGFILLIIPGLLLMARWSIAQPLLLAEGGGPLKRLGESWELTRGHEFSILVAGLALLIPVFAIVIACSALFDKADIVGIAISQIATSAASVVSAAMGVALYGLITGGRAAGAVS